MSLLVGCGGCCDEQLRLLFRNKRITTPAARSEAVRQSVGVSPVWVLLQLKSHLAQSHATDLV